MNDQLSLFAAPEPPSNPELARLLDLLDARREWITAREIAALFGWDDRHIRTLAASSEGQIISGNHGYKHTRHATPEEFHEFYGRMTTQAKEMMSRAEKARRVHHQNVG